LDGDPEANVAHYCLQELHILPSKYLKMSRKEKAFIAASILVRTKKEKEQQEEIKRRHKNR
jgi:hypothetical protein